MANAPKEDLGNGSGAADTVPIFGCAQQRVHAAGELRVHYCIQKGSRVGAPTVDSARSLGGVMRKLDWYGSECSRCQIIFIIYYIDYSVLLL